MADDGALGATGHDLPTVLWPSASFEARAARVGTGMERPDEVAARLSLPLVLRAFGFVDLSGFTAFTEREGPQPATTELASFRDVVRRVAASRGVRVAKWLGDGAMIVGLEFGPTVATCVELAARWAESPVPMRAGAAIGPVLLFEGDDYVGPAVNLAARLCDMAGPGEVLAAGIVLEATPSWIVSSPPVVTDVRGVGEVDVSCLSVAPGVELPALRT
jgi:adenylate cyclase